MSPDDPGSRHHLIDDQLAIGVPPGPPHTHGDTLCVRVGEHVVKHMEAIRSRAWEISQPGSALRSWCERPMRV